jgi:uncharacterized membrane protein
VSCAGPKYHNGSDGFATLWKNGAAQQLGSSANCSYSWAESVFVSGNDVYAAGTENNGHDVPNRHATLWKNGVAQQLSANHQSYAKSIFVK